MVEKLVPEINKVYFIEQYTMIHILDGSGGIEVDFKNYFDWSDKIIFLDKGQYIKFLSNNFLIRKIEFEDKEFYKSSEVRVLFKHLVSLGYINFNECSDCQKYLNDTVLSSKTSNIIDVSSEQWYWQNPFHANKEEYHVIFDAKEIIDNQYKNHLSNGDITKLISHHDINAHSLITNKIGVTFKGMLGNKRLLESKKEIAFTDKSIKEIAYDYGYKDPAYFTRVFKVNTGVTPNDFREDKALQIRDAFIDNLFELLNNFHVSHRNMEFYADQMNMSVKTLSNKVRQKLQISLGQLIRQEIVRTAKKNLLEKTPINEVANMLGFEEANHFSTFFKHHTKTTPSQFLKKKYK